MINSGSEAGEVIEKVVAALDAIAAYAKPGDRKQWLTKEQAAEYLQISTRTLEKSGVPYGIAGASRRYDVGELDKFTERGWR